MSPLAIPRRVHVIGLAGAALIFSGLFPPWIITNFTQPFPPSYSYSLWSLLVSQVTLLRSGSSSIPGVGFFLIIVLPCLTGTLISLAGLFGKGKRVFFLLQVLLVLPCLFSFLSLTYLAYCEFYCGAPAEGIFVLHIDGDRVLGPGFWLILGGFLVSLGASFAQYKLFSHARPDTAAGPALP